MAATECCLKGFKWDGQPTGETTTLAEHPTYKTGNNTRAAVLIVHDAFGWKFPNTRLLADAYAREADVTVYVPDFFAGESMPYEIVADRSRWAEVDFDGFAARNARSIREPEIFACAQALRAQYQRLGVVGYCYGGWGCFRLGAGDSRAEGADRPLVDCLAVAHPTFVTKDDIEAIRTPTLVLSAEIDKAYNQELKQHTFERLPANGVQLSFVHFPGVEHAFATRGNPEKPGERQAMARAKRYTVNWFREYLHDEEA